MIFRQKTLGFVGMAAFLTVSCGSPLLTGQLPTTSDATILLETNSFRDTPRIRFQGQTFLSPNTQVSGTQVGGLSGIAYDPALDQYLVISDAQSNPRFYRLRLNFPRRRLSNSEFLGVTPLQGIPNNSSDTEGIARVPRNGNLWISSEGSLSGAQPFIKEYSPAGVEQRSLALPGKYLVSTNTGIRQNRGFEGLSLSPDESILFVGIEQGLKQDEPEQSRILTYSLPDGRPEAEYLYPLDPSKGLTEILALNNTTLLALERPVEAGEGIEVRLYHISLAEATDIRNLDSLAGQTVKPVTKRLVADTGIKLGNLPLDNLEGMTLGVNPSTGKPLLILVSDNNFSTLPTRVAAFEISRLPE
jgi:3-phytase/alkaline phosphatase D